jgi:hypothetical protein
LPGHKDGFVLAIEKAVLSLSKYRNRKKRQWVINIGVALEGENVSFSTEWGYSFQTKM